MKVNFNIELPFFPGFYESLLLNSDTLYNELYDEESFQSYRRYYGRKVTRDDLDFDYDRLQHDLCEAYNESFVNMMSELYPDLLKSSEFESLTSPREYNFKTDREFSDIVFSENWHDIVSEFMQTNKDWLEKQIYEDWTSRDGFMSFLENDFDSWYEELSKDDPDERYISEILKYMLYKKDEEARWHLIDYVLEDFYYGEYIICTNRDHIKKSLLKKLDSEKK